MKIVNVILQGSFTEGMAYQENCLPLYQKKALGADVTVIAGPYELEKGSGKRKKTDVGVHLCENGLKLIRIPMGKGKCLDRLAYYPTLYQELEREEPDYIFVHLIQSLSLLQVKKYKKKHPNVLIYADSHADKVNSAGSWASRYLLHGMLWRMVIRSVMDSVELFYGVLSARVRFLQEVYGIPRRKTELLLMGAEDAYVQTDENHEIRRRVRACLKIKEDDFVLVSGGKIDRKKNLQILIEAVFSLHDSRIVLVLMGKPDKEMAPFVEEICKREGIRYVGWLAPRKMYELFYGVDLAVFHGTHSVLWEQAAGFGLPGIFRRWDGIDHLNRAGNVWMIEDSSPKVWAGAIGAISRNRELYENMKERAMAVREEFFYSKIALKSIGKGVTGQVEAMKISTDRQTSLVLYGVLWLLLQPAVLQRRSLPQRGEA